MDNGIIDELQVASYRLLLHEHLVRFYDFSSAIGIICHMSMYIDGRADTDSCAACFKLDDFQ